MRRLLSANLSRLWLNKAFWITAILMAIIGGGYPLLLLSQGMLPMDKILFISFPCIGVFISVFFSLFLGTEYNDGTIRNKLTVGHKRSNIYLANLVTGIIAVTIIYFAVIIAGGISGLCFFAPPHFSMGQIVLAGIIDWLACVSYIAIFNLIGMLSSSKARTSIISILTAVILVFAGMVMYMIMYNYNTLADTQNVLLAFLLEASPFGQTFIVMSIDVATPWKIVAYALILSVAVTGFGMYGFSKKDLK